MAGRKARKSSEGDEEQGMSECNFEKDLELLEQIVHALEEGGLSLDESLSQFEQGIKLSRRCEKALSEAEKKIEILTKKANGELVAEPFEDEAEAPSETKAKAPKVVVEETVSTETTTEVKAETRRAEVVVDSDDEGDDEDGGTMLF